MSAVSFIRKGGKIIPIISRSGAGRAVSSVKSLAKSISKLGSEKTKLKEVNNFRKNIPALQKKYAGTRYGDSLLNGVDASKAGAMRGHEARIGTLKSRSAKLGKLAAKANATPLSIAGVFGVSSAIKIGLDKKRSSK